jgi:hypothetical protein
VARIKTAVTDNGDKRLVAESASLWREAHEH